MKKTTIAVNVNGFGEVVESKIITAEVVGEWANSTKIWTDKEDNQYSLKRGDNAPYFILEAVDDSQTTWKIKG